MIDLYAIHERKARSGLLTIHPSRWLYAGRSLGQGGVYEFFNTQSQAISVGGHRIEHFRQLAHVGLDSKIRSKHGYYFAAPAVAERYYEYVPIHGYRECAVRDMLSIFHPEGQVEVKTPAGLVDLLLPNAVIEVKNLTRWKHALGQVLAYSTHYPSHARIVHFYVLNDLPPRLDEIRRVCGHFDVSVRYQSLVSSELGPASKLAETVVVL